MVSHNPSSRPVGMEVVGNTKVVSCNPMEQIMEWYWFFIIICYAPIVLVSFRQDSDDHDDEIL